MAESYVFEQVTGGLPVVVVVAVVVVAVAAFVFFIEKSR